MTFRITALSIATLARRIALLSSTTLSIITLSITVKSDTLDKINVMLSFVVQSVIKMSVVGLNVVAPLNLKQGIRLKAIKLFMRK
jgi:hypothetical protein